jgi:tetratricopeptide (TPR) repeat protein
MTTASKGLSASRPFAGLRAFDARDWKFFFGRSDQKAALYRLVDRNRFVAVIGSSGSGKSSLTRAGLLRLLQEENQETRSPPWVWCALRPGDAPIRALTNALTGLLPDKGDPETKRDRIDHLLTSSTFGCADAISEAGVASDARFVLVIDQFEELFRYSDRRQGQDGVRNARAFDAASQFVELLLEASRSPSREIHVLITMRSDFIGECAQFSGLAEAVSSTQFLVPGLTRDQLQEIICQPIADAGGTIDSVLVEQLLNDASIELDELPVLQHCLLQLWKRAGNASSDDPEEGEPDDSEAAGRADSARHITPDHYAAVGRIGGALSMHANRILRGFQEEQVAAVFRALSELRNGRAVRRALTYRHLREETGLPDDQLRKIVNRFRAEDCSFLLTSPPGVAEIEDGTRIDICHEALLRRWEKCGGRPDVVAADQRGPSIGWLERERRDGQEYQFLLSKAENQQGWAVEDIKSHRKWWRGRNPTVRWTERYGGGYAVVDRMLRLGWRYLRVIHGSVAVLAASVALVLAFSGYKIYSADLQARNNARIAQVSLGLGREVLKQALDDLNHGRMQVSAALNIEGSMQKIVDSELKAGQGRFSFGVVELESELNYTAADILYDAGSASKAYARARSSQDEANYLLQADATKPEWQGILCESTQRVGDTLVLKRDYEGALAQFKKAQDLAVKRTQPLPADEICSDLDYYHSRAGDTLLKLERPQEALAEFQDALRLAQINEKKYPDNHDVQISVPRYIAKIAQAFADLNQLEESVRQFDQALQLQEPLVQGADRDAALLSNLAISYAGKAAVQMKRAQWDDAVRGFRSAIAIHQGLVNKDDGKASWLVYLADEKHGLADACLRPVRYDVAASTTAPASEAEVSTSKEGIDALRDEIEIRTKLVGIDSSNQYLQDDLAKVKKQYGELKALLESRN